MSSKLSKIFEFLFIKHYKKIIIVPILILLFNLLPMLYNFYQTGKPFNLGIDITGGIKITVKNANIDENILREICKVNCEIKKIVTFGKLSGYELYYPENVNIDNIKNYLIQNGVKEENIVIGKFSGKVGMSLFKTLIIILIIGFILVTVVVYYYFRSILPAISITFSTFMDMVNILGTLTLLNIPISLITITALLMLIGYSEDSDTLLATYLYKRHGKLDERLKKAFQIEMKEDIAAVIVFVLMIIISKIDLIRILALTLLLGIIYDVIDTWMFTGPIQRIIIERRK